MFKKVFYSCTFTAALGGVALSDSSQYFSFDTEERDTSLEIISRIGDVHTSNEIFIKMPGDAQFMIQASGKSSHEDYVAFRDEVYSAIDFVKSSIYENGGELDCNSERVHPRQDDGWLTVVGLPLSDLKDSKVMIHRKEGSKVSDYPSELRYDLRNTANAYVCIDCDASVTREAIVREIFEYFSIQCKIENVDSDIFENSIQNFISSGTSKTK